MLKRPLILAVVGPTASGKTEVAHEISKRLPTEMISCDSMQVYKDMPILSQAPSPAIQKKLHAHLVCMLSPEEEYNAAFFRRDALKLIKSIHDHKKIPMICGGTGLYLRMLLDGLFDDEKPRDIDDAIRKKWYAIHEKEGVGTLHQALEKIDPAAAKKIHPNDARRLVRALEVYELTGKPISEKKTQRKGIRDQYDVRLFLLDRSRADLYDRINRRVDQMVEEGLLDEVQKLSRRKLSQTASVALGMKEMKAFLNHETTLENAIELLKRNTRHYAKRQLSWFRHETGVEVVSVDLKDTAAMIAERIVNSLPKEDLRKKKAKL